MHTHAQLISRIVLFSPLRAKERDWQRNAHMYMYTRCHRDIYSMDVMNINCSLQRKWILNKKGCSFRPCLVRIHASQVSKLMASCTLLKTHTLTKPNYRVCGCAYTMPFDQERFLFFIHSVCKAVWPSLLHRDGAGYKNLYFKHITACSIQNNGLMLFRKHKWSSNVASQEIFGTTHWINLGECVSGVSV